MGNPFHETYGAKEDEDDRAQVEEDFADYKQATVYAVHVSESMRQEFELGGGDSGKKQSKTANKTSYLRLALKSVMDTVVSSLVSDPQSRHAIWLLGTAVQTEAEGGEAALHLYEIMELSPKRQTQGLIDLQQILTDPEEFAKYSEPSGEKMLNLPDFFFMVGERFKSQAQGYRNRQLVVFTDDDNPCPDLVEQAKTRATDLSHAGIAICPMLLDEQGKLNTEKFWGELPLNPAYGDDSGKDSSLNTKPVSAFNLQNWMLSRLTKKRTDGSIVIQVGTDDKAFEIGAKMYVMQRQQDISRAGQVSLEEANPHWVLPYTEKSDPITGVVFDGNQEPQVFKAVHVGASCPDDQKLVFTEETYNKIKYLGDDVMGQRMVRIVGFKPMSTFKPYLILGTSRFLYPSDSVYTGSIRAFVSLCKSMKQRNVYAVAWVVPRANANPRFHALIPTEEEIDESGMQTTPPGIYMIPLAFGDEFKEPRFLPDPEPWGEGDEDKKSQLLGDLKHDLAPAEIKCEDGNMPSSLLRLQRKPYDPRAYPNMKLQMFYKHLANVAVNAETEPEEAKSKKERFPTQPNYKQIAKKAGEPIAQFNEEFERRKNERFKHNYSANDADQEEAAPPKKKNSKPGPTEISLGQMRTFCLGTGVNRSQYTVADIKAFAAANGLELDSTRKNDMIEEIGKWLEANKLGI